MEDKIILKKTTRPGLPPQRIKMLEDALLLTRSTQDRVSIQRPLAT